MLERIDRDAHGLRARALLLAVQVGRAAGSRFGGSLRRPGRGPPSAFDLVERGMHRRPCHLFRDCHGRLAAGHARKIVGFRKRDGLEPADHVGIRSYGLHPVALERLEDLLDAVDAGENGADAVDRDRSAVAILAHQGLGGVRKPREPGQPEETASALDGVDQPEDRVERLEIVRLLLETHELHIELIETFPGLGQEFGQ
jgi:hypothetical protein